MINIFKKTALHWPLPAAVCLLWCACGYLFFASIQSTNGHFTYTLDDAYIHMAIAKNIAFHGVYGVTPYEFSSSSSSIVWTLLLAGAFSVFGMHEILPLLFNMLIALFVLFSAYYLVHHEITNRFIIFIILIAIIFLAPLPAMIFSGMEHILHILLVLLFVYTAFNVMNLHEVSVENGWKEITFFFLLAMLLVMTRFESYAIVSIVSCIFVIRKRWKLAVGICLSAVLPLLIYQYISLSHGWSWLPNSILIRSNAPEVFNSQQAVEIHSGSFFQRNGLFANYFQNIQDGSHLYVLTILGLMMGIILSIRLRTLWNKSLLFMIFFIATALAHLQFGKIGHFFRYEAYLMAWGIIACALTGNELFKAYHLNVALIKKRWFIAVFIVAALIEFSMPIFNRGVAAWNQLPIASRNIYEQQYQMGLFLQRYYPQSAVAVNDIGAIAYLTDDEILDLVGLASADVLSLKMHHDFSNEQIKRLSHAKGVQIAIVYDFWLQLAGLNADSLGWKKVGNWSIRNNVVCGGNTVSFYAVQPTEYPSLIKHLQDFSLSLPQRIQQNGIYLRQTFN